MGRSPVTLKAKHPVAELKAHYQNATNAVERRRAQVVWLLASGKPRSEVIDLTAYSLPSVLETIHRYNADGLNGLRDLRESNSGAPTLLKDAELLLLAQTIRHDFEQGIVWRGADVQAWVSSTLGKQVRYQRAYEFLDAIGFSLQVPRPRHVNSSDAARADFKKTRSPTLSKRLEMLLEQTM